MKKKALLIWGALCLCALYYGFQLHKDLQKPAPVEDAGALSLEQATVYGAGAGRTWKVTLQQGNSASSHSDAKGIQGSTDQGDGFSAPSGTMKGEELWVQNPGGTWLDAEGRRLKWQADSGTWRGDGDLWSLEGPVTLSDDEGSAFTTPKAQWNGSEGVLTLPASKAGLQSGKGVMQMSMASGSWSRADGWTLTQLSGEGGGDAVQAPQAQLKNGHLTLKKGKLTWQNER